MNADQVAALLQVGALIALFYLLVFADEWARYRARRKETRRRREEHVRFMSQQVVGELSGEEKIVPIVYKRSTEALRKLRLDSKKYLEPVTSDAADALTLATHSLLSDMTRRDEERMLGNRAVFEAYHKDLPPYTEEELRNTPWTRSEFDSAPKDSVAESVPFYRCPKCGCFTKFSDRCSRCGWGMEGDKKS